MTNDKWFKHAKAIIDRYVAPDMYPRALSDLEAVFRQAESEREQRRANVLRQAQENRERAWGKHPDFDAEPSVIGGAASKDDVLANIEQEFKKP